jgi:hypothetical protein
MRLLAFAACPACWPCACPPSLPARPRRARPEPMLHYTVQPHDTLWDLSARWFRRPASWPEVARLNRLSQPDRLSPGRRSSCRCACSSPRTCRPR